MGCVSEPGNIIYTDIYIYIYYIQITGMLHMLETTVALVATYLYSTDSTSTYRLTSLCTTLFPPGRRCCTSHNGEGEAHSEEEAQEDDERARATGAGGKSIVSEW